MVYLHICLKDFLISSGVFFASLFAHLQFVPEVKPSLSTKMLSINNFTTKLLCKLLSDLYIWVHLKGTKKFGSKVINRQFFHRQTVFHMKILCIINFTTKLLSIKDYFLNGPQ